MVIAKSPEMKNLLFTGVSEDSGGPIPWMIEVAALLSAVVRRWEDFARIFVLLREFSCLVERF